MNGLPTGVTVAPRYGEASIIDILPGVLSALGVPGQRDPIGLADRLAGVRRIAVLLIDGLGYHLLPQVATVAPTLAAASASTLRLTTGFPSTTPTSLVGLGTGCPTGVHGTVGFTYRNPDTGKLLIPIRWRDDPPPETWQPVPTMFQVATEAGLATAVVARSAFRGSGLTDAAWRGARYVPADSPDGVAAGIIGALGGAGREPAVVYGYFPDLDAAGHAFGPGSPEWYEQAEVVEALVARVVSALPADAALLVTADHGMLTVPPDHRFDVDTDEVLRAGVAMIAGEPRARYVHVVPGALDDVRSAWIERLGTAASVLTRTEAIAAGWFGPVPPAHAERIGDLVVVARDTYVVAASIRERGSAELIGYHGSLTAAEMEIPLIEFRRT